MVATSLSPAKGGSEGKSTFQCQFPPIPPSTTIPLRERVEVAQEQQKAVVGSAIAPCWMLSWSLCLVQLLMKEGTIDSSGCGFIHHIAVLMRLKWGKGAAETESGRNSRPGKMEPAEPGSLIP